MRNRWIGLKITCAALAAVECGGAAGNDPGAAISAWQPTVVFMLGGQSNMKGQGRAKDLPAECLTGPANVRIWSAAGWTLVKPTGTFGPEVGFAAAMAKAWPRERIGLVKYAEGGTSLLAWAPDWTKEAAATTQNEKHGPLYKTWIDMLAAARRAAPATPVKGAFWMQGERDANYKDAADSYKDNFKTLITALRRDCGNGSMPFVFGRIRSNKFKATVRKAQEEAAREMPGVAMVDTDDLEPPRELHFGANGQLELGRRFAAEYLRLAGGKTNAAGDRPGEGVKQE